MDPTMNVDISWQHPRGDMPRRVPVIGLWKSCKSLSATTLEQLGTDIDFSFCLELYMSERTCFLSLCTDGVLCKDIGTGVGVATGMSMGHWAWAKLACLSAPLFDSGCIFTHCCSSSLMMIMVCGICLVPTWRQRELQLAIGNVKGQELEKCGAKLRTQDTEVHVTNQ